MYTNSVTRESIRRINTRIPYHCWLTSRFGFKPFSVYPYPMLLKARLRLGSPGSEVCSSMHLFCPFEL
ncbi:hypothetical protein KSP40_PGU001832 [Platanthera guangdongensis]|uniref:Uncharacterized protein n=1 Tax=Platanthera guangdongensis TaxID=2320717 RepID=A0ABR2MA14_9ASPA